MCARRSPGWVLVAAVFAVYVAAPAGVGGQGGTCDVESVANSNPSTQDSDVDFDTVISWRCREGFKERATQRHEGSFTETCTTGATLGQTSGCDQVSCDAHNDACIVNCHRRCIVSFVSR